MRQKQFNFKISFTFIVAFFLLLHTFFFNLFDKKTIISCNLTWSNIGRNIFVLSKQL